MSIAWPPLVDKKSAIAAAICLQRGLSSRSSYPFTRLRGEISCIEGGVDPLDRVDNPVHYLVSKQVLQRLSHLTSVLH
ncbi:MAG: hypothetical protein ACI9TF_000875 [Paracrocinitomix sp.]|jgi:hypothetical protein